LGWEIDGWCIPDPFVKDTLVGLVQLVNVGKVDERAVVPFLPWRPWIRKFKQRRARLPLGSFAIIVLQWGGGLPSQDKAMRPGKD